MAFVVREKHRLACRLGISLPEIDIGQFLCFRSFALGRFRLAFCRFRFFLRLAQFFFRFALLGFRLFTRRLFKVRLTRPQAFQFSFFRLLFLCAGKDAVDLAPSVVDGVHRFLVAFVPVLGVVNMCFDGLKHLPAPFGIAADGRRGNVGNLHDFLLSSLDFPDGRHDLLLEHFERFLHKPPRFIDALGLRLEFLGDLCAPVLDGGLELRELGVHRLAGLEPFLGVNVGNQPTRNLLDLVEHRDKVLLVQEKRLRVHAVRLDRELFSLVDKDECVGILFFHHFFGFHRRLH